MSKYKITEQEYNEVLELVKINKLKRVDRRLQVIVLRYEGFSNEEIAGRLGYSGKQSISRLCADFKRQGLEKYAGHKYGGNHRALDDAKEQERLSCPRTKFPLWMEVSVFCKSVAFVRFFLPSMTLKTS